MQYALLMRATTPETAVQSSASFSLGTTWSIYHVGTVPRGETPNIGFGTDVTI